MTMHNDGEQLAKEVEKLARLEIRHEDEYGGFTHHLGSLDNWSEVKQEIIDCITTREASHSHLIEEIEGMKFTQEEIDNADRGFLLPTLYLERKGHNQALDHVISLLKRKGLC